MKIFIDREGCIECGACEASCPSVFELKPGEKASVVAKYQVGEPGKGEANGTLAACIEEAVASCPVSVICTEG